MVDRNSLTYLSSTHSNLRSFFQNISIIRKDILSSAFNSDDLPLHAKLASLRNDSHSASWHLLEWQMLIKCTLGHHPS